MRLLFISVTLVISIISCSKDPTSTGEKLVSGSDIISTAIFDSNPANIYQKTSNYDFVLKTGLSSQLILGASDYGQSNILMKFNMTLTDTLLKYLNLNTLVLQSAWVTMDSTYSLGSETAPFDFYAYNITDYNSGQYWELGFDRDSVSLLKYDNTNQNVNPSPAVLESNIMQFNVNTNMVMGWVKAQNQINSTTDKNLGMLLTPKPGTNRFLGFDAVTNAPVLHCAFLLPTQVMDTAKVTTNFVLHYFTPKTFSTKPDEFVLEGSESTRGTLFFDLSSLPKLSLFNRAILTLTVDTLNTIDGTPSSNSIKVQLFADSSVKKLADSSNVSTLVRSGNQYIGDVDWIVQKWSNGKVLNQGLLLSLTDELTSVARIAIYSSTAQNKDLRPRLKLYYIQKNNNR